MLQGKVSLCVPIYRPPKKFFENLSELLDQHNFQELVVLQTLDDNVSLTESEILRKMAVSRNLNYVYKATLRSEYTHGKARNILTKMASSDFVFFFTTQDIGHLINVDLEKLVKRMLDERLQGICLRHFTDSPSFAQIFDSMFSTISRKDYATCDPAEIVWWSHNCAIYKRHRIIELPFPEIEFAEDLYWAKMARSCGYRLAIEFRAGVFHQNRDAFRGAISRGILEARGHWQGHNFLYERRHKSHKWLPELSHFLGSLKFFKARSVRQFFNELHLMISVFLQRISFLKEWNRLVKEECGGKYEQKKN